MADKLLCYKLQVQNKRDREYKDLFCFDDVHDLLPEIKSWINSLTTDKYDTNPPNRAILRMTTDILSIEDRSIIGQITTGRTGSGSKILSSERKLKANKETSDIDTLCLFFLIHVPQTGRDGIVICQDHDGLNPYQSLKNYLNLKFTGSYQKFKLNITPIVFTEIIDRFLRDGQLISLELKKRIQDPEEIEKINPDKNRFGNPFITYLYTPDQEAKHLKHSIVDDMQKIYKNEGAKRYLSIDFDNAKLTLEVDDKKRTINLEKIYSRANTWPLNEEISLDTNRIPVFSEVKEEALELMKSFPV